MTSPVKLPPLPLEVESVYVDVDGLSTYREARDCYYTMDRMYAYAEQAVREAQADAASAPVADERKKIAGVTLDGCLETLFRVGEHLGIDYAESRKQPGAPSGIYIKAIEDRVSQAINAAREEAAKLMDQTSRSSGATLIRALASAPVAGDTDYVQAVPLNGHSVGPLTPIYDYTGSLIGQTMATARHGAYEGSVIWVRMRRAGEWMPWHVADKQSAPVPGEAQPSIRVFVRDGKASHPTSYGPRLPDGHHTFFAAPQASVPLKESSNGEPS